MKNQALFSSKDESKKLKCRLLQFLFSALRVKTGEDHPLIMPVCQRIMSPLKRFFSTFLSKTQSSHIGDQRASLNVTNNVSTELKQSHP